MQPAYRTPENDFVLLVAKELGVFLDKGPPWPDVAVMLQSLETNEAIGWRVRWAFKFAVERIRILATSFIEDEYRDFAF